jgi:hypothetical protein
MAAHAEGADEHQRFDRIARGLLNIGGRNVDALGLCRRPHPLADDFLHLAPIGRECRNEISGGSRGPVGPLPGWTAGVQGDIFLGVFETGKKRLPLCVNRLRVGLIARVEFVDVAGIATVQKGSSGESRVRVLT